MHEQQDTCVRSVGINPLEIGWEDTLEKEMATHSCILGESHEQRNLMGFSSQGCKE